MLRHGETAAARPRRWVPDYFHVLIRGDRLRGTVNAMNVAPCLRELGLQLIAVDGRNLPRESELIARVSCGPLEKAVAEAGVQTPRKTPRTPRPAQPARPRAARRHGAPRRREAAPVGAGGPERADGQAPPARGAGYGQEGGGDARQHGARQQDAEGPQDARAAHVAAHGVHGQPGHGQDHRGAAAGQIFRALGVLSKGHLVETDRAGLVAGYVGQTALKVQEKVQQALGGMLFIDEAYALAPEDGATTSGARPWTRWSSSSRTTATTSSWSWPAISEPMQRFLDSNPGLRSRFNRFIHFDDYSADELFQILERMCGEHGYKLSRVRRRNTRAACSARMHESRGRELRQRARRAQRVRAGAGPHANRVGPLQDPSDEVLCTLEVEDLPAAREHLRVCLPKCGRSAPAARQGHPARHCQEKDARSREGQGTDVRSPGPNCGR